MPAPVVDYGPRRFRDAVDISASSAANATREPCAAESLEELLASARELLGPDFPASTHVSHLALIERVVASARERIATAPSESAATQLALLALDLQQADARLRAPALERSHRALASVQEALAELRTVCSVKQMIELSTRLLCAKCGFDRAVMFEVDGSRLRPASAYQVGDLDYFDKVQRTVEIVGPFQLHHRLVETDMVRSRQAIVVRHVADEPRVHHAWLDCASVSSYVAAPIAPEGRVIGTLHADTYLSGREVDEIDRDLLHAFSEGYGYALERATLLERLQAQRDEVRELFRATDAVLEDLTNAERQLAKEKRAEQFIIHTSATPLVQPHRRSGSSFTPRELDVLELLTDGLTNRQIANRLVVSEGTVKSYLKPIFRKLGVANRSEAISRYLRTADQANTRRLG